jgi:hypothetical protein
MSVAQLFFSSQILLCPRLAGRTADPVVLVLTCRTLADDACL